MTPAFIVAGAFVYIFARDGYWWGVVGIMALMTVYSLAAYLETRAEARRWRKP